MEVNGLKRLNGDFGYGVTSLSQGTGGHLAGGFREHLGGRLKEEYRRRFLSVLGEMETLATGLIDRIDLLAFERFLGSLKALLSEIIQNAYTLSTEQIMDQRGRRRVLSAVEIVDTKLGELAGDILSSNCGQLDYISRVDEIRGLLMDILL